MKHSLVVPFECYHRLVSFCRSRELGKAYSLWFSPSFPLSRLLLALYFIRPSQCSPIACIDRCVVIHSVAFRQFSCLFSLAHVRSQALVHFFVLHLSLLCNFSSLLSFLFRELLGPSAVSVMLFFFSSFVALLLADIRFTTKPSAFYVAQIKFLPIVPF